MGKGAAIARFLEDTQTLLQMVSLDDPQSIRPHFERSVRVKLQSVGSDLIELLCSTDQMADDMAL